MLLILREFLCLPMAFGWLLHTYPSAMPLVRLDISSNRKTWLEKDPVSTVGAPNILIQLFYLPSAVRTNIHKYHNYLLVLFLRSETIRETTCPPGVCSTYAPPEKVFSQDLHTHMPVPLRFTESFSHLGHAYLERAALTAAFSRILTDLPPLTLGETIIYTLNYNIYPKYSSLCYHYSMWLNNVFLCLSDLSNISITSALVKEPTPDFSVAYSSSSPTERVSTASDANSSTYCGSAMTFPPIFA